MCIGGLGIIIPFAMVSASDHESMDTKRTESAEINCAEDGPVLMVVSGKTLDSDRMQIYGKAIRDAGLYPEALGYYLNDPRPFRGLEGDLQPNFATLVVRFPSDCAATSFWHSKAYQDNIKPLRENPSAGDYLVTLYREVEIPSYMTGKVGNSNYIHPNSD